MVLLATELSKSTTESVADCSRLLFPPPPEIKRSVSLTSRTRGLKADKYSRPRGGGGIVCKQIASWL